LHGLLEKLPPGVYGFMLHYKSRPRAVEATADCALYLYEGNFCNRTCAWCTINGSPRGTYHPYSAAVLDKAIAAIAVDGNLKFYGGEPTLHAGSGGVNRG
jgi:sulfatase maturation enzyme AslB (radical SAM superfamily)